MPNKGDPEVAPAIRLPVRDREATQTLGLSTRIGRYRSNDLRLAFKQGQLRAQLNRYRVTAGQIAAFAAVICDPLLLAWWAKGQFGERVRRHVALER